MEGGAVVVVSVVESDRAQDVDTSVAEKAARPLYSMVGQRNSRTPTAAKPAMQKNITSHSTLGR